MASLMFQSDTRIAKAIAFAEKCKTESPDKTLVQTKYAVTQREAHFNKNAMPFQSTEETKNEHEPLLNPKDTRNDQHHFHCDSCNQDQIRVVQILSHELRNLKLEHAKLISKCEAQHSMISSLQDNVQQLKKKEHQVQEEKCNLQEQLNEANLQIREMIKAPAADIEANVAEESHADTSQRNDEIQALREQVVTLEAQVCVEREQRSVYETSAKKLGNMVLDANRALLQERERFQELETEVRRGPINMDTHETVDQSTRRPWSQHFTNLHSTSHEPNPTISLRRSTRRRSSSAASSASAFVHSPAAAETSKMAAISRRRRLSTSSTYYSSSLNAVVNSRPHSPRISDSSMERPSPNRKKTSRRSSM